MGHIRVAGVVSGKGNGRSSELAGRRDVPMTSGVGSGVENLGSTTELSVRLWIVLHCPPQGSAGETERSGSIIIAVSGGNERRRNERTGGTGGGGGRVNRWTQCGGHEG